MPFELRADDYEMILRLLAALVAGAFIGYERSFHGRPAGLRTHVLVCLASALLMLVTVYEDHWVRMPGESRLDPTRMAQGIMTGIGFLGAGVIVKEGLNVRGRVSPPARHRPGRATSGRRDSVSLRDTACANHGRRARGSV